MKKRLLAVTAALIFSMFFSLAFVSCDKQKTKFVCHSLDYFDTATTITGYEESKEEFDRVSGEILKLLSEYHKLYTIYHRFEGLENLCTINDLQNGAHRTVSVDSRITDMLLYSKDMYDVTNGKFNIAMGSVLSIWHTYRTCGLADPSQAQLPPKDKLTEAAKHTDIKDVLIDAENNTVYLQDPEMTLDVGAVAKGYAVEMAAKYLEEQGISGYVINVGGNVRTVGTKPNGESWLAGIENPSPDSDIPYVAYLNLSGESLVTSGSYQRFYTVDGINYHHIIDPETLMPAKGYLSVSVLCCDSALGDALSTALFCMPYDSGISLVESLDGVEALWIMADGSQKYSSGFDKYLAE
ncbi:MAG: FAD:protein FMN transferase [Ruminococcaceae bacterium]|nr:FAD:protein FMN transferase [Oscillospiraceae bacterium]